MLHGFDQVLYVSVFLIVEGIELCLFLNQMLLSLSTEVTYLSVAKWLIEPLITAHAEQEIEDSDIQKESSEPSDDRTEDALDFGKRSVELRGGLVLGKEFELVASGIVTCVGDIAISGVSGWCSLIVPSGGGLIRGRVYVPRGVEAYLRPHIPVPDPFHTKRNS